MIRLEYPESAFRIKKMDGKEKLFDPLRKKWIVLTPEEWVRQNFLQVLVQVQQYPATLIALEKEIRFGELRKRFDILVYDQDHQPWLMVECKAMDVDLSEKTLQQILTYHAGLPVNWLIITNGATTYGWQKANDGFVSVDSLPLMK
ncbi:MAG TPA: type I restriction enzyme HsdR N-terminal domain-containing protein [Chitinophagaceae bacterium]|nr:type I restriction enzyme HsdR N-terminal domain-containing protein [Chitinophagaceae bacterium]